MIINGKNAILGRLSSAAAKKLMAGEEIVIVNAEKAVITGNPKDTVKKYIERKQRGSPQHGPFFPKQPDRIVYRTIRGMMPKTPKGRNAMKKLHVCIGVPSEYKEKKTENFAVKPVKSNYIRVGDVAKTLGWLG